MQLDVQPVEIAMMPASQHEPHAPASVATRQARGADTSTCSICGDSEHNEPGRDLPKWWVRAWKVGEKKQARVMCLQCALVIPIRKFE